MFGRSRKGKNLVTGEGYGIPFLQFHSTCSHFSSSPVKERISKTEVNFSSKFGQCVGGALLDIAEG